MTLSPEERRTRMAALRRKFLDQLRGLMDEALGSFDASWGRPGATAGLDDARRRLHTMAGTLGTFGFHRLMEDVRALEGLLFFETQAPRTPSEKERFIASTIQSSIRSQVERLLRASESLPA
jgi:chemotaxis protein histidine kinase CheA